MITIDIGNVKSQLVGVLQPRTQSSINSRLSYEMPGAFYAKQYNPYAGVKWLFNKKTQMFPTGLIHYVREILDRDGVDYELVDKRIPPASLGTKIPLKGFELREYQQIAVDAAIAKQRGILKVGTGGGKTNILTGIVANLNVKTLILIHKTDIFYQLVNRIEQALGVKVGRIGDGECDIQPITVGMVQSIYKVYKKRTKKKKIQDARDEIANYIANVECIITDECHHVAADSFWEIQQNAVNAFYRFGFSASPWREDNADLLIEAAHARQLVDYSASWLIQNNFLVKPIIFLYEYKHQRKQRTAEYPDIYDEEVVKNATRNEIITDLAVNCARAGKTVLIAVTKIEHGQILEKMIQQHDPSALFVCGESDSQERQTVLKELDTHSRNIVICTTIFGEGVDCPGLDVLINAKAAASSVDSFQLIGRVLRPAKNKSKAYVIDIFDHACKYLEAHANARLRIYESESEYEIQRIIATNQVVL